VSEGKHTPGPWIASKFGFQVLTGDSWTTICTLKDGAEWEDGRGNYEQEFAWQKQEANAVLIAAAPTLLAALEGALVSLRHSLTFITSRERMHPDGVALHQDSIEAVKAAIDAAAPPVEAKSEVGG
jgi:hypothetical protein